MLYLQALCSVFTTRLNFARNYGTHVATEVRGLVRRADGPVVFLPFFFFNKFIYLFLAVLGLRCCTRAFSSCGEQGLLLVAVHGLLIAVASLVAEHGL